MSTGSLFDLDPPPSYPEAAGHKATGTSQAAAQSVNAVALRSLVLTKLAHVGPMTADECAVRLGKSLLSIRPRFSELHAMRLIVDTGDRRRNVSGKSATVWRAR